MYMLLFGLPHNPPPRAVGLTYHTAICYSDTNLISLLR